MVILMKKIYFREKYLKKMRGFYHDTEMIKVITGVHRCGKSTLLEMIAEELLKDDVKKENIVFIILINDHIQELVNLKC